MEGASQVRRAAREAVGETDPERLRTRIFEALDAGSMVPGVLVILGARAAADDGADDGGDDRNAVIEEPSSERDDGLARRAAGVQLIYEGLELTRTLASEEPWSDSSCGRTAADIEILAADVLVARGFYLLARTECAARAVETVRRFGRDQTHRRDRDADADTEAGTRADTGTEIDAGADLDYDRRLEADALDLAMRCGVSAVGADVPADLDSFTADLVQSAADDGGFPAAEEFFSADVTESLATLIDERAPGVSESVPPATDGG